MLGIDSNLPFYSSGSNSFGSGSPAAHSSSSGSASARPGENQNGPVEISSVPTRRVVEPAGDNEKSAGANSKRGSEQETQDPSSASADKKQTSAKANELTDTERKQVDELRKRDQEVRNHEAAHLAAAGQHARGGIKLDMTRGPDGRSYAIGGSVDIDTSPESNPEATIRKADQIRRAALAPAEPSGQDRAVAAEAAQMKLQAQVELAQEIEGQQLSSEGAERNPTAGDSSEEETAAAAKPSAAANRNKLLAYSSRNLEPATALINNFA